MNACNTFLIGNKLITKQLSPPPVCV